MGFSSRSMAGPSIEIGNVAAVLEYFERQEKEEEDLLYQIAERFQKFFNLRASGEVHGIPPPDVFLFLLISRLVGQCRPDLKITLEAKKRELMELYFAEDPKAEYIENAYLELYEIFDACYISHIESTMWLRTACQMTILQLRDAASGLLGKYILQTDIPEKMAELQLRKAASKQKLVIQEKIMRGAGQKGSKRRPERAEKPLSDAEAQKLDQLLRRGRAAEASRFEETSSSSEEGGPSDDDLPDSLEGEGDWFSKEPDDGGSGEAE